VATPLLNLRKTSVVDADVAEDGPVMGSSVQSTQNNVRVGMNILRGAHDHGQNQINSIDEDIANLLKKLHELQRDKAFTQIIVDVAAEYYGGADRPSGTYSVSTSFPTLTE